MLVYHILFGLRNVLFDAYLLDIEVVRVHDKELDIFTYMLILSQMCQNIKIVLFLDLFDGKLQIELLHRDHILVGGVHLARDSLVKSKYDGVRYLFLDDCPSDVFLRLRRCVFWLSIGP